MTKPKLQHPSNGRIKRRIVKNIFSVNPNPNLNLNPSLIPNFIPNLNLNLSPNMDVYVNLKTSTIITTTIIISNCFRSNPKIKQIRTVRHFVKCWASMTSNKDRTRHKMVAVAVHLRLHLHLHLHRINWSS